MPFDSETARRMQRRQAQTRRKLTLPDIEEQLGTQKSLDDAMRRLDAALSVA